SNGDVESSMVPSGLVNGETCVSIHVPGDNTVYGGYKYNGPTAGDAETLRAALNNRENWANSGSTALPANMAPVAGSFDVSSGDSGWGWSGTINFDDDGGTIISAGDTDYEGNHTSIEYSIDEKNLIAESSGTEGVAIEDLSALEGSVPSEAVEMKNAVRMAGSTGNPSSESLIIYFKDNVKFDIQRLPLYAIANFEEDEFSYVFE